MIDRIVVPLDGSRMAEQILPHLRRLLFRHDSEVILVRAAVLPLVGDAVLLADPVLDGARDYLLKIQDQLVQQGARVRSVVRLSSPARLILEVAEEEKATMLALATHGETGLKRLLAGSVAEALLRRSPVPVLLVRPFWSYELLPSRGDEVDLRPIQNILVPLDEQEDMETLHAPLIELAELFGARVVLLNAQSSKTRKEHDSGDMIPDAEAWLAGHARALEAEGVETLSILGKGDPAADILATARAHEIDLIAMTSHRKSGLLRFFSDSVTEKVLHDSTCPILVVKSPAIHEGHPDAADPGMERRLRAQ